MDKTLNSRLFESVGGFKGRLFTKVIFAKKNEKRNEKRKEKLVMMLAICQ
jgi:hypothetical protein